MKHTVQQGECLSSISAMYGLNWQKIWTDPRNASLKASRKNPNVLFTGDVLLIPDKEEKTEASATDAKHRFVKLGKPTQLRLRLLVNDKPRRNLSFKLQVANEPLVTGKTDGDGFLRVDIPPMAREARLEVADATVHDTYHLKFGDIDPIGEVSGLRERLRNLGFPVKDNLEAAVREFQKMVGLNVTGEADPSTLTKLQERYGL